MKACSAPGPDGLPVVFFQNFWEVLRPVILPMFHVFYIGTLDMARINYGVISLFPKVVGYPEVPPHHGDQRVGVNLCDGLCNPFITGGGGYCSPPLVCVLEG